MKSLIQICLAVTFTTIMSQVAVAQASSLSKYDQLKVAVQKICPVSGNPLTSMGDPLKVRIGEEEIFLCCKGCTKGQINKQHWTAIHSNFAKAQGICPVMEKELPESPKWTVVNGQIVYICCPPCTKKIQTDPRTYLAKVAGYYQNAIKATKGKQSLPPGTGNTTVQHLSKRDQIRVAVQKICPVSGDFLGKNGTPLKVKAGGIDLFLCCEGCKEGNVTKEHWATIRNNFVQAQGICPVMEKELPANAKSTIVNGQLVFVCCPPCTKKIANRPEEFLRKIDSLYMASLRQPTSHVAR